MWAISCPCWVGSGWGRSLWGELRRRAPCCTVDYVWCGIHAIFPYPASYRFMLIKRGDIIMQSETNISNPNQTDKPQPCPAIRLVLLVSALPIGSRELSDPNGSKRFKHTKHFLRDRGLLHCGFLLEFSSFRPGDNKSYLGDRSNANTTTIVNIVKLEHRSLCSSYKDNVNSAHQIQYIQSYQDTHY
jgi:hypothetical protein